jgi:phage tail-like protein
MVDRTFRYLGFKFQLSVTAGFASRAIGGFSEVSGLSFETAPVEYRPGAGPANDPRKYPGVYKATDVTLKRGVVSSTDLFDWMEGVRAKGILGRKDSVVLTLLDGRGTPVTSWTLRSVAPKRYTGPTLGGKGGADVAMLELVLSAERIEITPHRR